MLVQDFLVGPEPVDAMYVDRGRAVGFAIVALHVVGDLAAEQSIPVLGLGNRIDVVRADNTLFVPFLDARTLDLCRRRRISRHDPGFQHRHCGIAAAASNRHVFPDTAVAEIILQEISCLAAGPPVQNCFSSGDCLAARGPPMEHSRACGSALAVVASNAPAITARAVKLLFFIEISPCCRHS